ncbi:MAG: hypothetical protein RSB98_03040, partial [Raoultibacter sp.]
PLAEVRVLIVDKDNNSGNASSTLLERYNMEREIKPTSKTELKYFGAWEPKPADASDLSALARGEESQKLMRVLYDDYERTALSEKTGMGGGFIDGFKGHPNVGATYQDVALQDGLGSKKTETAIGKFFSEIEHDIKNTNTTAKVFIVASLFGGTGASGLPLLVQRLRRIKNDSNSSKLLLGTLMMLPYFTYKRPKNVEDKIQLDRSNLQTQAALQFYHENGYLDPTQPEHLINDLYLLGLHELAEVNDYCEGGSKQCNKPVFVELTGAMSIAHFFKSNPDETPRTWTMGVNMELADQMVQLTYGALAGDDDAGAFLKTQIDGALRYAMYYHVFVYWALFNWNDVEDAKVFLPDNATKHWLGKTLSTVVDEKNNTKEKERSALKNSMDRVAEESLGFINWLVDLMDHSAQMQTGSEKVLFEGFTADRLKILRETGKELSLAYRRDDSLGNMKPIREKHLWNGVQTSKGQAEWQTRLNGFFSHDGPDSYGAKILLDFQKKKEG